MDTGSHLLFGATLAGLAQLSPDVQHDPTLAAAVLCATLAGSHAPDMDLVFRLRGKAAYVKHHRGWSHSLPALLLWPLLIAPLSAWAFGVAGQTLSIGEWTLLAVVLHVLFDLTNAYGVQCLLPLRRGWLHLDSLCLTDPALLLLHGVAAIVWAAGGLSRPGSVFLAVWLATGVYAAWRILHHAVAVRRVRRRFRRARAVYVLPDLMWHRWHYVVETDEEFRMGTLAGRRLLPSGNLPGMAGEPHDCVRASRRVPNVQALLHFAKRAYFKWQEQPDGGYLVTWTDLRFWRERDWPFRAEVRLDRQLNVVEQRLGWHKKAWEPPYV